MAFLGRTVLFSFNEKAAESYRLIQEVSGDHVPSKGTCKDGFAVPTVVILMLQTRDKKKHRKGRMMIGVTRIDGQRGFTKTQKYLSEQLNVSQLLVSNHLREMEKIRKTSRWRVAKTHAKFCSLETKESQLCILSSLRMTSGFIFRI